MILEELEELQKFVLKETDVRNVSVITQEITQGYRALISHGSEDSDGTKPLMVRLPVTITISDAKENYRRVMKTAETIQVEFREQKGKKWNSQHIERVESDSEYILIVHVSIPLIIS